MRTIIFPHRRQSTNDPIVRKAHSIKSSVERNCSEAALLPLSRISFSLKSFSICLQNYTVFIEQQTSASSIIQMCEKNPASRFLFKEVIFF